MCFGSYQGIWVIKNCVHEFVYSFWNLNGKFKPTENKKLLTCQWQSDTFRLLLSDPKRDPEFFCRCWNRLAGLGQNFRDRSTSPGCRDARNCAGAWTPKPPGSSWRNVAKPTGRLKGFRRGNVRSSIRGRTPRRRGRSWRTSGAPSRGQSRRRRSDASAFASTTTPENIF